MQSEVLRLLKEHGAGFLSTMSTGKNAYIILISLNHLFIALCKVNRSCFHCLLFPWGCRLGLAKLAL